MITKRANENGFLVYKNTETEQQTRIWQEDLLDISGTAHNWQSRPTGPCNKLAQGDYSYRNLAASLAELLETRRLIDTNEVEFNSDGDDYLDLVTAIEDLAGIVGRIERIT